LTTKNVSQITKDDSLLIISLKIVLQVQLYKVSAMSVHLLC